MSWTQWFLCQWINMWPFLLKHCMIQVSNLVLIFFCILLLATFSLCLRFKWVPWKRMQSSQPFTHLLQPLCWTYSPLVPQPAYRVCCFVATRDFLLSLSYFIRWFSFELPIISVVLFSTKTVIPESCFLCCRTDGSSFCSALYMW